MGKINLVLADSDDFFLKSLSRYILDHNSAFEVNIFTSDEYLLKYISNNSVDILLIEEGMLTSDVLSKTKNIITLILDDVSKETATYIHINKYQKTEAFLKEITFRYAEGKGDKSLFSSNSRHANVISVYSPVGGSGKTTFALALAGTLAKNGVKVFYLNMEKFNSSVLYFGKNGESISEIFLKIKNKTVNLSFEIIKRLLVDESGVKYLGAVESAMEFDELTSDELNNLINELASIDDIDYLILDLPTEFDMKFIDIVKHSNYVSVICTEDSTGVLKLNSFLQELSIFPDLKMSYEKIIPVINKSNTREIPHSIQEILKEKQIACIIPQLNLNNVSTVTQLTAIMDNYILEMVRLVIGG